MTLYIKNHDFRYELECLCRLFFPDEKIIVTSDAFNYDRPYIAAEMVLMDKGNEIVVYVDINGEKLERRKFISKQTNNFIKECERTFAVLIFGILSSLTGIRPKWGILTGIRPVKLMKNLSEEMGLDKTLRRFRDDFLVSDEKISICKETMQNEQRIIGFSKNSSFSLYISVPFCPTRCSYCSFVSHSVEKTYKLIPSYIDLLCEEIRIVSELSKNKGLNLETVYVGGGTPTSLTAAQLEKLMLEVNKNFDLGACREFTVEAGRPDTITQEKLAVIKDGGVTRISINPQTLNDEVLKVIGRDHTTKQTLDSFSVARENGFDNINMDLIAGLPSDDYRSFADSLEGVCKLSPESITVHTLSKKRASNITKTEWSKLSKEDDVIGSMLNFAEKRLKENGYVPYYLYRQSRMVGNLENIGWCKPGFEGLYNIYTMDETHTILACGAGAVTKIKDHSSDKIERVFNYKFPHEYISKFEEMLKKR